MENFKPILLNFSEAALRSMAMEKAETIVIRKYFDSYGNESTDGTSQDIERPSTETEKAIITNLIYGALLAIRWRDDAAQSAMDTAEFTADLMIDGINGYMSVYLPIMVILRSCHEQAKEAE